MTPNRSQISILVDILNEAYGRQTWHGPNLKGSLRGTTEKEASWRPGRSRHNIWEIAVHAAYWKYIVRRRLLGEKRGSFPLAGSNWFKRPEQNVSWREERQLLESMHRSLTEAVSVIPIRELHVIPRGSKYSNLRLIYGVAMHDVYHAGQIQLLKKLRKQS